ncbi:MAG: T9SS type A sorting domain-containing protein, partial [Bacteroidales bacterium]
WTEPVIDIPSVKRAIAEGGMYVAEQQSSITAIPASVKLWLTEYGATKKNMDGTWGAALRAVSMTLGWFKHSDLIETVMWHHVTDDPNVIRKLPLAMGPVGIAMGEVMHATKNKTGYRQLFFNENPPLVDATDIPSLLGYCFSNATGEEELLLVNLGDDPAVNLSLPSLFPDKKIGEGVCYSAANPFEADASLQNGIRKQKLNELATIVMEPFSIIRLKLTPATTSFGSQQKERTSFCFDPMTRQIRFFKPGKAELMNSSGQLILQSMISEQESIDLSSFLPGHYIIRFNTYGRKTDLLAIIL